MEAEALQEITVKYEVLAVPAILLFKVSEYDKVLWRMLTHT